LFPTKKGGLDKFLRDVFILSGKRFVLDKARKKVRGIIKVERYFSLLTGELREAL